MNKISLFLVVMLLSIVFVYAENETNTTIPVQNEANISLGDYCNFTQPATFFREERNFTGIYGRFSNGSLNCFMPSTVHRQEIVIQPVTQTNRVPEFSTVTFIITIVCGGMLLAYFRKKGK